MWSPEGRTIEGSREVLWRCRKVALCQHHGSALRQLVDLLHAKEMLVPRRRCCCFSLEIHTFHVVTTRGPVGFRLMFLGLVLIYITLWRVVLFLVRSFSDCACSNVVFDHPRQRDCWRSILLWCGCWPQTDTDGAWTGDCVRRSSFNMFQYSYEFHTVFPSVWSLLCLSGQN